MANIGGKLTARFRESFQIADKKLQWFPGHMSKGLRIMQSRLKAVDCVIEVHDARVPLSGHYADYKCTLTGLKPHIFILNKKDLMDLQFKDKIVSRLKKEGKTNVLFTNFNDDQCIEMKKILPLAKDLIKSSDRYNRSQEESFALMVIGVPNVGKSSLINRLRNTYLQKPKATRVGGVAGITRSVLTQIKVSENPDIFLYDTPGILCPVIRDIHTGLKLALVGCLQDHLVGYEKMADYLLFWLNRHEHFQYVKELGLPEPNDNIHYVLTFIAAKLQKTLQIRDSSSQYVTIPDIRFAADHFIQNFRKGTYGKFCLDEYML